MKIACFAGALSLIPSMAFGFGMKQLSQPKLDTISPAVAAPVECTDFSGTWRRTCTNQSDTDPAEVSEDTIKMKQYKCESIGIDNDTYHFNGSHSVTDTTADDTSSFTFLLDWNSNKTAAILNISVQGRGLNKVYPYNYTGTGGGDLKLVNGQVVSTFNVKSVVNLLTNGTQKTHTSSSSCTYEKQP